jgi:dephospho-CoA kinase
LIVVGLTGGIASGKSTVSRFLEEAGARIVDADKIAREVVEPGSPAYADILAAFGKTILTADGQIDRKRLGQIIFNDPNKKKILDAIVHPRVFGRLNEQVAEYAVQSPGHVVIMDIPLLFETGSHEDLSEVIVVYVPENIQLARLMKRDGIGRNEAMARIRSQMAIETKRQKATIVIDNSGKIEATRRRTLEIYEGLKSRA